MKAYKKKKNYIQTKKKKQAKAFFFNKTNKITN